MLLCAGLFWGKIIHSKVQPYVHKASDQSIQEKYQFAAIQLILVGFLLIKITAS
jgi:hypothetical protein